MDFLSLSLPITASLFLLQFIATERLILLRAKEVEIFFSLKKQNKKKKSE